MKKHVQYIFLITFLLMNSTKAQGKLTITSDSTSYSYGQPITLKIELLNETDSILYINICPGGCFIFDDFDIGKYIGCAGIPNLPISPGRSITWQWKIDPSLLGLPNKEGEHIVIGYYGNYLADTIKIYAPVYYGGAIWVAYLKSLEDKIIAVRDSLNAKVIQRNVFSDEIDETWQIKGILIDSVISKYRHDSRFKFVERYNWAFRESITTSIENVSTGEVIKDFEISEAFPNPFNSITKFYIIVNRPQNFLIEVFNSLGQKVSAIYNGTIQANSKTYFTVDLNNSTAGLYFIQVKGLNNIITKKIFLLK